MSVLPARTVAKTLYDTVRLEAELLMTTFRRIVSATVAALPLIAPVGLTERDRLEVHRFQWIGHRWSIPSRSKRRF
jgi:hypothetical protein